MVACVSDEIGLIVRSALGCNVFAGWEARRRSHAGFAARGFPSGLIQFVERSHVFDPGISVTTNLGERFGRGDGADLKGSVNVNDCGFSRSKPHSLFVQWISSMSQPKDSAQIFRMAGADRVIRFSTPLREMDLQ